MPRESAIPSDNDIPPALAIRAAQNRSELVRGLKATVDLAKEVSIWRAGDLYRVSGKCEVILNLKPASDGSVMGWAHGSNGRFIGQARWTKATTWGSRVVSSAAVLAGHAMLVEISHKLDRIEAKLDRVRQALNDDRRQALKAAIDQTLTALACDPTMARDLLIATATPLRTVILQEIQAIRRAIEQTPIPSRFHAVRFVWDAAPDTRRDLAIAEDWVVAVLQGIRTLTQLYIALGQDRAAWTAAHDLLVQLSETGLEQAWWKARNLLPENPQDQPEAFWARAMTIVVEGRTQALAYSRGELVDLSLSLSDAELEVLLSGRDNGISANEN